jgi:hemerythrin
MMLNFITWRDDFLLGVDEVDQQHKYLFELINETLQCEKKTTLQASLKKLENYTKEHFSAEEALMKTLGYSNYKQHQEKHNLLVIELNEKSTEALRDPMKKGELDSFLISWLILHILGDDLDIGEFCRNNPVSNI